MSKFKLNLTYLIDAEDKKQALDKFSEARKANTEDVYFAGQYIFEVEHKGKGWGAVVGEQLFGK